THSPILIIAIPLLAAFLVPLISKAGNNVRDIFVIAVLSFVEFLVFILAKDIYLNGIHVYTLGASPLSLAIPEHYMLPVRIVLEVDGLSIFMGMISATVSLAGAAYSLSAIKEETGKGKFYTLLLLLTVGMLGMEFTGDMFNLFIFLEILSISGSALASFRTRFADAVEGGFKYIIISTVAALMVLFAVGIFYGQYNLLNIAALAQAIQYTTPDKIALALLVIAFVTKAGGVPSHWWVPDTYTPAPAGTSPMIYAATLACMATLFRVCFTLFGVTANTAVIGWVVIIAGVLSMFVGVTMALLQSDVKRLMAYHVISQGGYMLLGVGVGIAVLNNPVALATYGREAVAGGLFHVINHAFFKGLLLLTGEALFFRLGTRDLNKMGGMGRNMKFTCAFFIIGALAISGVPPFNGFASKLMIYEAAYQLNPILTIIAMMVSIITLASFTKVFQAAFTGPALPQYKEVKEVPISMRVGMGILAGATIFFSLFPSLVVNTIIYPAADALINQASYIAAVMGGA
ncbi:MAG: proton-conducting transporter membrane subunit, partial [Chloroflexota bacterium]|nr:proton-conducting transporter membrane subunit [Chloroflexota bacterium]